MQYDDDMDALVFTGHGVHLYVLDTGINYGHPEFDGRIADGHNAVSNEPCADPRRGGPASSYARCTDQNGHGSHVAGTSAGATKGVASQAIIHPVRVFEGPSSNAPGGFIWATNHFTAVRHTCTCTCACARARTPSHGHVPVRIGIREPRKHGSDSHHGPCIGLPPPCPRSSSCVELTHMHMHMYMTPSPAPARAAASS